MSDEQFQAWLEKHGGEVGRKDNEKQVDDPAGSRDASGAVAKVTTVDSTTIKAKDGATITLRRMPGPAGAGGIPAYQQIEETPPTPRASSDESVSAPPNQQNIATRQPDGTIKWVPNPNYQPPQPTPRTPEQQATDAAAAQTATAENKEKQWNSEHGHGWVTNAQRDTAIRQEQAQARADQNVARQTAAQEAANQLARDRLQFDREKANLPDVKPETITVNGIKYTRVTKITPQGQTTITNYGPDGKEVPSIPSEGEASVGGPPLPVFIANQSEQTLQTYWNALQNDPHLTPEQRSKRFAEATQVANVAVQNAATAQRERESTRNAEYNTAASKLSYMQTGLGQALDFVSKLNGNLPEGSDLGGKAFAAILGLQMLQLQRSGINTLPSLTPPTITSRDLHDTEALTAHNQTIAQQTAQAANPLTGAEVAAANASTSAASQAAFGTLGIGPGATSPAPVPAPGDAPAPGASPPATPSMTQPGAPAAAVTAEQAADYAARGVNPATGEPFRPESPAAPGDPGYQEPAPIFSPVQGDPTAAATPPAPAMKQDVPGQAVNPDGTPDFGAPGMRVLPQPDVQYGTPETMTPGTPIQVPGEAPGVSVPYPDSSGATSRAPAPEWPALAQYAQAQPQAQPSPAPDYSTSPALLHVQAASKPPWRMTPEELAQYRAAGVPDDVIWSTPRQRSVA